MTEMGSPIDDSGCTRMLAALEGNYQGVPSPGQRLRLASKAFPTGSEAKRPRLVPNLAQTDVGSRGPLALRGLGVGSPQTTVDVFDFFAERGSETQKLQRQLEAQRQKEAQLQQHITSLETEMQLVQDAANAQKARSEAEAHSAADEKMELQHKLERAKMQCHRLELDLQEAVSAKNTAQSQMARSESATASLTAGAARVKAEMEARLAEAKTAANEEAMSHSAARKELQHRLAVSVGEVKNQKERVKLLEKQNQELEAQLKDMLSAKAGLEASRARTEAQVAELEVKLDRLAGAAENEVYLASMRQELSRNNNEVQAARRLKKHVESVEVLKEKLRSAEAASERAEAAAADAAEMRERVAALEQELARWAGALGPESELRTPEEVARRIISLQTDVVAGVRQLGESQAALQAAEEKDRVGQRQVATLEANLTAEQERVARLAADCIRLQRRTELLEEERANLQQMVHTQREQFAEGTGGTHAAQQQVLEQLVADQGKSLEEWRGEAERLQKELADVAEQQGQRIAGLAAQVAELEQRHVELRGEHNTALAEQQKKANLMEQAALQLQMELSAATARAAEWQENAEGVYEEAPMYAYQQPGPDAHPEGQPGGRAIHENPQYMSGSSSGSDGGDGDGGEQADFDVYMGERLWRQGGDDGAAGADQAVYHHDEAAVANQPAFHKPHRILHYKHNPAAAAIHRHESQRIVQLEAENKALRRVMSHLSHKAHPEQTQENNPAVQAPEQLLEREELLSKLAVHEKRGERIVQLFTNQVAALRSACRELLGYTIEMEAVPTNLDTGGPPAATIRLRSSYAAKTDVLEFSLRENHFALVETDFSRRRAQDVEIYVRRPDPMFPAFTANITLELCSSAVH